LFGGNHAPGTRGSAELNMKHTFNFSGLIDCANEHGFGRQLVEIRAQLVVRRQDGRVDLVQELFVS
jgi:hypothetical protein